MQRQHDDDMALVETIKRLTIVALVSDDRLMDRLVLKGGNAISFSGVPAVRKSVDLDFSIDGNLDDLGTLEQVRTMIEQLLDSVFSSENLRTFDVSLQKRPTNLREDVLGDFWGGYELQFKIMNSDHYDAQPDDARRSRRAIVVGPTDRRRFSVDLSKHEYCAEKVLRHVDDFGVYVYSGRMIICEKVRAICQQMPEYRKIVHSSSARPRARDFFDIWHIAESRKLDFASEPFGNTLKSIFDIKRVPLRLLGQISNHREFHRDDFNSVRDSVERAIVLDTFDFYVDYLVKKLALLQPLWEEQPPTS
jgi:predicted nucleotidyltransferase component of viral defense system